MPDKPDSPSPLSERCLEELTEIAAGFLCPVEIDPDKIKDAQGRFQSKACEIFDQFPVEDKAAITFEEFLQAIRKICRQRLNKELGHFGKALKGSPSS